MFGRGRSAANEQTRDYSAERRKNHEIEQQVAREIESLAEVAEREVLTKRDEMLADALAEHEQDRASYKVEFKRWGDFVALFMARRTFTFSHCRADEYRGEHKVRTLVSAINLRDTREFRLIEGSAPDLSGWIDYNLSLVGNDDKSTSWGTNLGRYPAPDGYHYEVKPNYPLILREARMYGADSPSPSFLHGAIMGDYSYRVQRKTPFARVAIDDRIHFDGIGGTLFAPAGMGANVHAELLREIGRAS